jgi:acyl-CoA hydrolase
VTPTDQARLLDELKPGLSVFVQGATVEPQDLIAALKSDPDRSRGVRFTAPLLPGINGFDYAGLHADARLTSFMASDTLRASTEAGRVRIPPLSYSQIARAVAAETFDLVVLHLTRPDARGQCSFGVSGDFGPLVWRKAKRRIGILNSAMPRPPRAETLPVEALDLILETDQPLPRERELISSPALDAVSIHVAGLIPDNAALQTGIGGAPASVLGRLRDRRGLVIRSGMVTEGYRALHEAGALAADGAHVTGIAYGSEDFYGWLAETDLATFASVERTHGAAALARTPRFTSINSALEVDLFGQANLEWRGRRAVSGVGGAPDFARGATASEGGMSIIALPSTAGAKPGAPAISRIVARLDCPTVSLTRHEVDVVVTEHGVARLRGRCPEERAQALIAVAAPEHQSALADAWRDFKR